MPEELNPKRSISSEDECWDSLEGLWRGDLEPLAEYLEQQTGTLHPLVQRELAAMIRGERPIGDQMKRTTWKVAVKSNKGPGRPKGQTADRDKLIVKALSTDGVEHNFKTKLDALQAAASATGNPASDKESAMRMVERALEAGRKKRGKLVRFMRARRQLEAEKANDKN